MTGPFELEPLDKELETALRRFRDSAHAWSAQEYAQVSLAPSVASPQGMNTLLRWALATSLLVVVALIPIHREQVRKAEQVQAAMASQADAQLLENVDTDVSRQVPASMSPLTSLIASDESGSEQIPNISTRQGEKLP
jgi:hypothetical protein